MFMNIKNSLTWLLLIVFLAAFLRFYKIDSVPPSLTWDEAAVGYNAWTIANYGRDEYGKFFPFYFRSFGEDKQPIHIYITAAFVKIFGLSEFSTRLPAAIFGTLNVIIIFFLARILFKSNLVGILSAFFLSISPQNIYFSRFNHEANFALFFFMSATILFYLSFKNSKLLILSILAFILSMISYHAAEIVVPPIVLLLFILYFKRLMQARTNLIIAAFLVISFIIFAILQPRLLGISRFNQTVQKETEIEKTEAYKLTRNYLLGRINLILIQYSWHLDPKYLLISGDKNPRLSSQGAGEFYKIDIMFLILGIFYLIKNKSKERFLLLGWALLGPLPSALFAEAPHAARAYLMTGSWHIIAALGFLSLINSFIKKILKSIVSYVFILIFFISFVAYFRDYLTVFPKRYAIDWQYGMKQVVEYVKEQKQYNQIYTTAIRGQPYIFYLYFLKISPSDYLNSVIINNRSDKSFNAVSSFNKYSFGGWNPIENKGSNGVLYVLTPSEYDGLLFKLDYETKKIIYYPNGSTAFYIVSLK